MSWIIVDAALRDRLLNATTGAEFRDEQGRLLGRFVPPNDPDEWEIPELGLSEEELARRLAPDAKTYTTAEVLSYLRSLK
jgi:hypothetical protein